MKKNYKNEKTKEFTCKYLIIDNQTQVKFWKQEIKIKLEEMVIKQKLLK